MVYSMDDHIVRDVVWERFEALIDTGDLEKIQVVNACMTLLEGCYGDHRRLRPLPCPHKRLHNGENIWFRLFSFRGYELIIAHYVDRMDDEFVAIDLNGRRSHAGRDALIDGDLRDLWR